MAHVKGFFIFFIPGDGAGPALAYVPGGCGLLDRAAPPRRAGFPLEAPGRKEDRPIWKT